MIPIITPQLRAFLQGVLRSAEGTAGTDEGYRALFGWRPGNGRTFDSFADHPRQFFDYTDKSGQTIKTSAAGAWQETATTFDDFCRAEGRHDFSPQSQQDCAAWLVWKCGAVEDVEAGRLLEAMQKCAGRWASLPTSEAPQPHRDYQFCRAAFIAAGGLIAKPAMKEPPSLVVTPQPDFPTVGGADNSNAVSGGSMLDAQPQPSLLEALGPIATMINPIAGSLITAFAPALQQKVAAAVNRHTDDPAVGQQVAGNLSNLFIALAQQLSGKSDPVDAVSAVKNDPDLLAKAQSSADQSLSAITAAIGPIMDKLQAADESAWQAQRAGRDDASNLAIAEHKAGVYDMTKALVWFAGLTVAGLILLLDGGIVWQVVVQSKDANSGLIGMAGTLSMAVITAFGVIYAYRFDGSKASSATQAAMAEMAGRRTQGAST